ncbi:MAG: electron transfer flavoprotein subunit alpha/FixB family protein [Terriglobia bacterium]
MTESSSKREVLIVAEHQAGKIVRATWEAAAAGQHLAKERAGSLALAVLGPPEGELASQLASVKAAEVISLESPLLREYTADGYTAALLDLIRSRRPACVVFGHTYQTRDYAPKLAAALGCGLVSDCLGYRIEGEKLVLIRQVFQGKFNADVEPDGDPPYLLSFQAGAFREDAVERVASTVKRFPVELTADRIRTAPGPRFREAKQSVDLSQAEIIVAAGRGIKGPENLELVRKLAEALGGEVGASRPVCDSAWLPMDRQIGSSGQTVSPRLYVAVGVSGAIQHQVGMKGSRTVVAINKDREAPIFEIASYGIVGDLFEIVPAITEAVRKARAE